MTKAIITDLDRTLLRNDKSISEYTINTMLECKDRGILLIAATARPERTICEYDRLLGFDAAVTLNGAVVSVGNNKESVFVEEDEVLRIVTELLKFDDCVISLETAKGLYSNVDIPEWSPVVYEDILSAPALDEVFKILVSSKKYDLRYILEKCLGSKAYYSIANGDLFQIMSTKATKWKGIEAVLKTKSIDAKDIIYFGDDYDDIESIRQSGIGVAVSNAIEDVKKVADCIIDSNENDGVAKYINEKICQ